MICVWTCNNKVVLPCAFIRSVLLRSWFLTWSINGILKLHRWKLVFRQSGLSMRLISCPVRLRSNERKESNNVVERLGDVSMFTLFRLFFVCIVFVSYVFVLFAKSMSLKKQTWCKDIELDQCGIQSLDSLACFHSYFAAMLYLATYVLWNHKTLHFNGHDCWCGILCAKVSYCFSQTVSFLVQIQSSVFMQRCISTCVLPKNPHQPTCWFRHATIFLQCTTGFFLETTTQTFLYVSLNIWLKQRNIDRKYHIVSRTVATLINSSSGLWINYPELHFFFHP